MRRMISITLNDKEYFYCGWYMYGDKRYPKYTVDRDKGLIFLNRAYAINMTKTNEGFVLIEDELTIVNQSSIHID